MLEPTALFALVDPRPAAGVDFGRYLAVVGGLLVALGAVAWGARRLVRGTLLQRANRRSLHVVDVLPLGGRRQLAVVRCYDRTFALGLGEKQVSLVAELDPVVVPAAAPTTPASPSARPPRPSLPQDAETRRFEGLVERAKRELERRTRTAKAAADDREGIVA